ncbi:MAG: hypothetical protein N2116_00070 [Armatimonadetes bacterium]|nr:hypothetical protein [Armatimonadota bacterium]
MLATYTVAVALEREGVNFAAMRKSARVLTGVPIDADEIVQLAFRATGRSSLVERFGFGNRKRLWSFG